MNLRLNKKGVKLQKHNQFRHAELRSPERDRRHLKPKSVIPDLIRNLQTLFQSYSLQRMEIPHQVRDDALFGLQYLYITKFNDLISISR